MAHIGVSVNDETKDQWENYIERTDYGSMSELIRTAVRKEMRRESGGDKNIPRELETELNRVAETQNTLQEQMAELVDGFEDVTDVIGNQQYPDEVIQLAHDIAGDLNEISRDAYGELESEVAIEHANLAEKYLDDDSKGYLVQQAFQYLEGNLSYIRRQPLKPTDYYRIRGRQ